MYEPGAKVDWMSFTIPVPDDKLPSEYASAYAETFGGLTLGDRGMYGYVSGGFILGTGRVLWSDNRREMGVHFQLPASAIARLDRPPADVCAEVIYALGGHFTRFDVATDTDSVDMDVIIQEVRGRENLVCKFRRALFQDNMWAAGRTVYLGAASSDCRVRFYDKAAEQDVPGVWTRCEVQFRREKAHDVATVAADDGDIAASILSVVDFRDLEGASNVTRAARLDWWAAWVATAQRLAFTVREAVQDLDRMREWIERQVSSTLSVLMRSDGAGDWLVNILDDGWFKAPAWKRALVGT